MNRLVSVVVFVCCCVVLPPQYAIARNDDTGTDSDPSRLERRREELFLPDDVLDPSFAPLDEPSTDELLDAGNSDSVIEEPLDPDEPEAAEEQGVIAGEIQDETDKAMERDHFDDDTDPFDSDPDAVDEDFRDPVEW